MVVLAHQVVVAGVLGVVVRQTRGSARVRRAVAGFDGASVPRPWLVTAVGGGILRPLGVMLIASIIHDFALLGPQEGVGQLFRRRALEMASVFSLGHDLVS